MSFLLSSALKTGRTLAILRWSGTLSHFIDILKLYEIIGASGSAVCFTTERSRQSGPCLIVIKIIYYISYFIIINGVEQEGIGRKTRLKTELILFGYMGIVEARLVPVFTK